MMPLGVLASARVAPSGGPTTITDTFTRADSTTTLGSTETGQAWQVIAGTAGILSGQARGYTNLCDVVVDFGTPNMAVSVDYVVPAPYLRIFAHYVDSSNYYGLLMQSSGLAPRLYRLYGGVEASLTPSTTVAAGDRITMEAFETGSGTRLRVLRNGVEVFLITDTSAGRPLGTKCGMRLSATGQTARWDNFETTEVTA